jgi:signal transduction histidine kinase
LAGRLAHELNQPLTAISNYAQGCANRLQTQRIDGRELTTILELIRDAALRAGAIVDRLGNFARRKGPQPTRIDLASLIRKLLDMIEPEIRGSHVQVELNLPAGLPLISADEFQIEQAIVNLVRNAIEAMSERSSADRRLIIICRQTGADEVEVAVCDHGRGVQPDLAERSFEPFFSTKPFGLGMGLPISRSIVESHGGRIWLDQSGQMGACFRFTLPIKHGETSNGDGE